MEDSEKDLIKIDMERFRIVLTGATGNLILDVTAEGLEIQDREYQSRLEQELRDLILDFVKRDGEPKTPKN